MTAVLWPVVILASWHECETTKRSVKTYLGLLVSMETLLIGVFAATDVFLFYVFFEAMLIPMYFIIGAAGTPRSSYAALKFLLYSLFGGLMMLAAVIGLYVLGGHTFLYSSLQHMHLGVNDERWLFLGFFVAFARQGTAVAFPYLAPRCGGRVARRRHGVARRRTRQGRHLRLPALLP